MRRTRIGIPDEQKTVSPRTSVREAMLFDVIAADKDSDVAVAAKRVSQFTYGPWLLAGTHLIVGLGVLIQCWSVIGFSLLAAPLLLAVVLGLDALAAGTLLMRKRLDLAPHSVARMMAAYIGVSAVLWISFVTTANAAAGTEVASLLPLALGAGMVMTTIVCVGSPPLAIVNALVAAIGALLFARNALISTEISALSLANVAYSAAVTRLMLASSRRRFLLDWSAQKSLNFVAEFEASGRGWFWETTHAGTLSYVSQQLADDFGTDPESMLGRQFTDLLSVDSSPGETFRDERTLGFHLSARFPFSDVVVRPANDQDVHWSLSGNPVFDDNGRFLGFRGIGTDLTEQRRSEQEISRLARFDSLTGLPNRAMMRQTLDEALRNAATRQRGCSLFLIDLDRFKNVNDTLGHPIGDALLKQVGLRLTACMGEHGQIGRLGGDEFKAVLPGTVDIGLLEPLAKTLIEQVSRPYMIEGHRVTIGASVGIAIGDPGRACADSLIRNADLALYAAKGDGRGKHCFYEASMHSEASDRQILENDLRQVLERNELSVCYQPIVRTAGEEISGFEALVRWQHPKRGAISPDKFIPLAEECGMIARIGEFVLHSALDAAAQWPDDVRIAVNLSPIQFNDPGIVEVVAKALESSGVRPARLELEITEGVFLAEGDAADETFAGLKKIGVRLALDDFGTGYSSLGYLKKAPFDKIKIDQSFVRGAASISSRNAAIIRAIVTLADSLGMDTTAEGVETHDDLQLMRDLGVSQIQGYIFGRPASAEIALSLTAGRSVAAEGHQCTREPRQRLMRRALSMIDGKVVELRLRNISAMGSLVDCDVSVVPGLELTIDVVGVGPVAGVVRWSQPGRFGVQFHQNFDLARLAPKRLKTNDVTMLKPWYVSNAAG
jgi:diguanylate cyclase (GGDEF)-like protein